MTRRRLIATRTPEADGSFGAAGAWRQAVKATRFVTAHVPAATSLAGAGSRTAVNKPRDADSCPTRSIEPVFHSCPRNTWRSSSRARRREGHRRARARITRAHTPAEAGRAPYPSQATAT